jgi:Domain of unknown function (DUF4349)
MKTEIRFLEELEEDLLGAASLEEELAGIDSSAPRPRSPRKVVRGRRRTVRTMSLAAAAAVLMAAVVGYVATRGAGNGTRQALPIPSPRQDQAANLRHDAAIIGRAVTDGTPYAPTSDQSSDTSGGGVPLTGPLIVKTANLSLTVGRGKFSTAFTQASGVASQFGGFVDSSSSGGTNQHSGQLTIRVPADRFDQALAALRPLGRVDAQTISGQDVTAKFVDLNARLKTWQAQETALLKLMAKASTVDETLKVQSQLQRVQLTIEELEGQIRLLDDQTANATITVSLAEAGATPSPAKVTNPSLSDGWRHAIAGFFGVLFAVVVGFGYVVPIAVAGLILWFVIRWGRRRTAAAVA